MNQELATHAFWDVTAECLVRFHGMDHDEAHKTLIDLRARLRQVPGSIRQDAANLIYHEEPFYVACHAAGRDLSLAEHRDAYDEILHRHGW